MKTLPLESGGGETIPGDREPVTGQPIEEAEKNLSRHATRDSSPPVDQQWRTSVMGNDAGLTQGDQETNQHKVENDGDKE